MQFKIGNIEIKNNVVLAPMAGISNPAYIKICEEMGAGYAVTELISAEAIVRDNKKTFDMLKGIENLKIPVAVQIFGSNEEVLANAAKIIYKLYNNVFIDINMGCPVPKVAVKSEAGSALLKNPSKVAKIVVAVVDAVPIPVTVKIRSGWDESSINAVEIAKIIEDSGAKAITIHPRTRKQGYSGLSNWNIIKQVKENVSIPVIGNGDIKSCFDAKMMFDETNCDAVMIGRAALGNPWIIKETVQYIENNTEPHKVNDLEKIDMILKHLENLLETKNEKVAILEMRSHAVWYLKGIKDIANLKEQIFKVKTSLEFKQIINDFRKEKYNES
ncbi:MAG: tRNA dihydrouridine synthase DusB [Bacilli bacterium]